MKKDERLSVGDRIARARDAYRLSQAQLSLHLNVTRAAVSQYEKDMITPRPGIFERLAELFNSDVAWFETGRGKAPEPLDAPVTIKEIDVGGLHDGIADLRRLGNGREWRLPAAVFAAAEEALLDLDYIVAVRAPNDAEPIRQGDHVLIDTCRCTGEGVFLVVDPAAGAQLRRCCGDQGEPWIAGRVITYLRAL